MSRTEPVEQLLEEGWARRLSAASTDALRHNEQALLDRIEMPGLQGGRSVGKKRLDGLIQSVWIIH